MTNRSEIRKKLVAILKDNTECADRVFANRARQLWPEELPAILIYTRTETSTEFESSPRSLKRDLRIAIEVVSKADEDVDDELDRISQQVENLIHADDTLQETVSDCLLSDVEMSVAGQGETVFGSAVMTFRVIYITEAVASSEDLPDLETVNVKFDLQNSDLETIEAESRIELP